MLAFTGSDVVRAKSILLFQRGSSDEKKRPVSRVEPAIFDLTDAAEAAS
jgi:hypothetical protein